MSLYWSYLTNGKNEILTFESHDNYEKMVQDCAELANWNYFEQFVGFNRIFVSSKNPTENPIGNKLFELNLEN
jgi:hypothetical protein